MLLYPIRPVNEKRELPAANRSIGTSLHQYLTIDGNGNTTYLEVLTARQSLLAAQLSQTANQFKEIQSLINLYQALGGGQEL